YGIPQIHISPYNSQANGVVERGHFIIREAVENSSSLHLLSGITEKKLCQGNSRTLYILGGH
ncbi:hypothetical protein K439DRAFT_1371611, partial [Ramaria rubella]